MHRASGAANLARGGNDRTKTDRREAITLAKLHRAGELTPVWVPDQAHEAIRDLVRARQAGVRTVRQGRQQLSGFLLRHGHHYNRPAWTLQHRCWLSWLQFQQATHYIVLEDCVTTIEAATARLDRLEAHIEAALADWSLAPVVRALQALRGMGLVGAVTLIAELGDITRLDNPRQIMAYLGLMPSEHSSGRTRRQGGITKAGNGAARRMLIKAAWSYRFPARISREQLLCQESLAKPIRDTAWKAQERLCRQNRKLAYAGKPANGGDGRGRHASWRALSGRSPSRCSHSALEPLRFGVSLQRRLPPATKHPKLGKAGGTVTARRTLASTISRHVRCWLLDSESSATQYRSGGNQPARQSMINRRFMIVPPALPRGGHAEKVRQTGHDFLRLQLEVANMRAGCRGHWV